MVSGRVEFLPSDARLPKIGAVPGLVRTAAAQQELRPTDVALIQRVAFAQFLLVDPLSF